MGAAVKLGMRTLPPTLCMMHGGGHGSEESICLIGWTFVHGSRAKVMSSGNLSMGTGSSRKSPGHTVVAEGEHNAQHVHHGKVEHSTHSPVSSRPKPTHQEWYCVKGSEGDFAQTVF